MIYSSCAKDRVYMRKVYHHESNFHQLSVGQAREARAIYYNLRKAGHPEFYSRSLIWSLIFHTNLNHGKMNQMKEGK